MKDAVERFLDASTRADVPEMLATLAPNAALVSPLVGSSVFRGEEDLRALLRAVYTTLDDLRWSEHHRDGDTHTVMGSASVLGVGLTDAMILTTEASGRITVIRPHVRPWLGLTAFAVGLAPRMAGNLPALRRSMRPAVPSP